MSQEQLGTGGTEAAPGPETAIRAKRVSVSTPAFYHVKSGNYLNLQGKSFPIRYLRRLLQAPCAGFQALSGVTIVTDDPAPGSDRGNVQPRNKQATDTQVLLAIFFALGLLSVALAFG